MEIENRVGDIIRGSESIAVPVAHNSDIGEARRAAQVVADGAGLSDETRGTVALVTTEAATNLVRHAKDGLVIVRPLGSPAAAGVEILALDRGPGIRDLGRALADGFSTAGTAGKGLGAIRRLASEFDLFSSLDSGTVLMARVWGSNGRPAHESRSAAICVPLASESVCGDGWLIVTEPTFTLVVVADGLGHGPEAARAAREALRVAAAQPGAAPAEMIQAAGGPLRPTRGAALAVARIEPAIGLVRFAGVGNIIGQVVTASGARNMASNNGIVGHQVLRIQENTYPWPAGGRLVMHTDGLSARWRTDAYPGLLGRDPALLAGVLYRDFARGRDDATIVVIDGQ